MNPLTVFLWGDAHFGYDARFGEDDLRWKIIDQMNGRFNVVRDGTRFAAEIVLPASAAPKTLPEN